jgi:mono/diheme cytochrome c family protein
MRGYLGFGVCVLMFAGHASSEVVAPTFKGLASSGGSAVALANFNGALVALVADEDDSAIHVFETKPPKEIAVAKVPGTPGQVLVTKTGKVLVSLRDKGQVAVLEAKGSDPRQLVLRSAIDTGGEPIALATTPDESTLIVASAFSHEVSGWSLADRMQKFHVDVAREPRALAISSDGSKAFVNHAVGGVISVVDIANGTASAISPQGTVLNATRTRVATQGFAIAKSAGKIFVPTVMADPETPETYYGSSMETFGVVVIDEATNAVTGTMVTPNRASLEKCLLPRAAAVAQGNLFVGCAGEIEMPMLDATSSAPMANSPRSRTLGDSPSAMAFDNGAQTLIVWSQMNRTVTAASFAYGAGPATSATVAGGAAATAISRGRRLFHDVTGKVASDGRTCASCHTDGRDDGLVWSTPEGNRQTPMLAGRLAGTAPYGWTRGAKTFGEYVKGTIQRLQGSGFNDAQLGDLEAYVLSLKTPHTAAPDAALAERGAKIFTSNGCSSCHSGSITSDGASHWITGQQAGNIATPSLRFVGSTAPYFHDGRYKDLRALLTSSDSDMGRARALPAADLDALEGYLRSL